MALPTSTIKHTILFVSLTFTALTILVNGSAFWHAHELHWKNANIWLLVACVVSIVMTLALAATINHIIDGLIRTKNYSESALQAMSDMLFILNSDDEIEHINQAVLTELGYSRDDLLGQPLDFLFPGAIDLVNLSGRLQLTSNQGFVSDIISKSGKKFPVSVSSAVIATPDERAARVLVAKDISEYKKRVESEAVANIERERAAQLAALNDRLVTTQVHLVQTSKFASLGEMAGGIAHEINNPLTIIHGNAGAIKELTDAPETDLRLVRLMAERIEATAMRISKIIKGLRSFARDGEADPFDSTTVTQIIDEVVDLSRERLHHQKIELIVDTIPEGLTIECREIQIIQIVMNLVNNARDAIGDLSTKWIKLSAKKTDEFIEISVTDSGHGVPDQILEKMFQPFFTTKELGKGTGLGLSISKGIVESHRGKLFYDSVDGNTRFVVRLPRTQPQTLAA